MWEATVRVEREQLVDALPEKVWELAGSPAALSVFPGWFAFGVPGTVAGTDRLCCLLVSGQGRFHHPVVDIRRVIYEGAAGKSSNHTDLSRPQNRLTT